MHYHKCINPFPASRTNHTHTHRARVYRKFAKALARLQHFGQLPYKKLCYMCEAADRRSGGLCSWILFTGRFIYANSCFNSNAMRATAIYGGGSGIKFRSATFTREPMFSGFVRGGAARKHEKCHFMVGPPKKVSCCLLETRNKCARHYWMVLNSQRIYKKTRIVFCEWQGKAHRLVFICDFVLVA